jgi:dolichol-phosphate mannosyltransferase
LYLGAPDLLPEEAYYWNYAQHPALGYLDHPPLIAWLIGAGTALLGHGELGVRSGALLCWAIAAWFSYGLARNLYDKTTGILALLLVSTLPYFACAGFVATPDAPLLAAWAGALYFLERATRAGHARAWLGFGACLGLGLLSKYTIVLVGAASLVYLLGEPRTRRWLTRPEPCAGLLLGLFLFSPVVLWNYRNDWASFAFQTVRRTSAASRFSLPALVLDMALLLTPAGLLGAGSALAGRPSAEQAEERSRWRFQATLTLVPLLVFCLFSLTHRPRLNWTGPVWLAVLPLLAHRLPGLLSGSRSWLRSLERRLWKPAIAGSLLALGAGLHFLALGLPGLDFDDVRLDKAPVAWEEIGAAVDQIAEQIEQGPGQALVVGMDKYSTASELAFYRSASTAVESTTSNHLFGSSGLMYRFWQKEPPQEERPLLLVSLDPEELRDERIFRHLNEVGSIEELAILKGDAHAGTLYYRLCRGYAPSLR